MTPHVVGNLTIKYITHVRSLMKEYTYQRNRNPNPSEEFPWLNNYSVVEKPDSPNRYGRWSTVTTPMHIDRTSENTLLRKLFDTFTHLRGFSVSFPGAGTSHDGITQAVGCYDLPSYEMIMDSLVYGLRSAAFQNLVDLSVIVPGTHDVGRLAAALSDGVKSQLKHLWMSIVDKSGPGGSPGNRYEHDVDDEGYVYQDGTLEDIEESGYIPSNLQLKYPNREYQNEVWQFIKSCKTLESLGLKSTHYLDLTRLEWAPGSNSQGLKSLSLERIHTSAAALIALLGARDDEASAPALQRAKFRDVKIYGDGGLWGTVFEWMTKSCPDLEFFQPYNIGYLSPHPYFSFNNRPYENGRVIWTEGEADEPTMLRLIRKLVQKAGGPEYYPDHVEDYDWEIIDDQP
ncbi:hypothetical protein BX600DRAFT_518819 [Xylariales sp. PMI_506]|nr:hypothetical protein BX600DRAFT_518819 [Xylariales sp. PMI_506]